MTQTVSGEPAWWIEAIDDEGEPKGSDGWFAFDKNDDVYPSDCVDEIAVRHFDEVFVEPEPHGLTFVRKPKIDDIDAIAAVQEAREVGFGSGPLVKEKG